MLDEALHVLAEDDLGPVLLADAHNVAEEGAAGHALVVVVEAPVVASDGERLAGEASEAYVERRDVPGLDLGDVARDGGLALAVEVGGVGLVRPGVELRDEDGPDVIAEGLVEAQADAAYAGE